VLARVLSLANYQPGAIERAAALLARRSTQAGLSLAVLDAVTSSREGASTLTADLQRTLRGDPRHAVLLYCLALACWQPPQDVADEPAAGVSSGWFAEQASQWRVPGFDTAAEGSVGALLDEMLVLGLLRMPSPDRFILGTPNLVRFLGTEEELLETLLDHASRVAEREHVNVHS
jgi:hypothetical protein